MDNGTRNLTLGQVRAELSGLVGEDIGEVEQFVMVVRRHDGTYVSYGSPSCPPCRVSFLGAAISIMAQGLEGHEGDVEP